MLLKPALAGLIPYWGEDPETGKPIRRRSRYATPAGYHEAKWPPVLDWDVWEKLLNLLSDSARRFNPSNADAPGLPPGPVGRLPDDRRTGRGGLGDLVQHGRR